MNMDATRPMQPFSPQIGAAVVSALAILTWLGVAGLARLFIG